MHFKTSLIIAALPYLSAYGAPLGNAGNGVVARDTDVSNINPIFLIAKEEEKRDTDTDNLRLVVVATEEEKRDTNAAGDVDTVLMIPPHDDKKRDTDTDNLRLVVVATEEEKRDTDISNINPIFLIAKEEEKRDTDTDNLRLVMIATEEEKRDTDVGNIGPIFLIAKENEKREAGAGGLQKRRIVSPYSDDVDAADPVAVLGD